jgi:alginate O-acetyltransferase complex protein AlgI
MVFSSPLFVFLFLPLVLLCYYLAPRTARNALLFSASVFFYAWGEKTYVLILLTSLSVNYGLACAISQSAKQSPKRFRLIVAIVFNLGLLIVFKYARFLLENISFFWALLGGEPFTLRPQHLPIGISFFTFQSMSYVIDIYRGEVMAQRNFLRFGLYVFLFPHLIAGPIVRYRDIAGQLAKRRPKSEQFADGIRRFVVGLAKKTLLANTLATTADALFKLPPQELSAGAAWLGILSYTLQIYFDFSGYSDMAIGLGKMFGFTFLENFRYPYISASITEFWRRWHISLSSWFRDYVYIPLGGNRRGRLRTFGNLLAVFLLCGLWHGANWTFVVWGLLHGTFLVIERLGLGTLLEKSARPLRHIYTLLAIMIGWVVFRCDTLAQCAGYFGALAGLGSPRYQLIDFWNREIALAMLVAIPACLPVVPWITEWQKRLSERQRYSPVLEGAWSVAGIVALHSLLFGAAVRLAAETYQPFIYFRF